MYRTLGTLGIAALIGAPSYAAPLVSTTPESDTVEIFTVSREGIGKQIGTVKVTDNEHGLVFDPELSGLEPGLHGFHVHEYPSCTPNEQAEKYNVIAAGEAGGHYDPESVDQHSAPWGIGHQGDLPNLYVNENGEADQPVLAPGMKWEFLKGHSLIIHANRDNYKTDPPKGGSGERIACGVFLTDEMPNLVGDGTPASN